MGNRVVPLFSKFLYINISLFHEPMIRGTISDSFHFKKGY